MHTFCNQKHPERQHEIIFGLKTVIQENASQTAGAAHRPMSAPPYTFRPWFRSRLVAWGLPGKKRSGLRPFALYTAITSTPESTVCPRNTLPVG